MISRKVVSIFSLVVFSLCAASSSVAAPITINDNYIGALPTNSGYVGRDIVGTESQFSVEKVEVELSGENLTISIFSTYFDNVGLYFTELGDFFLSVDGWNPFGTAPYENDQASNGEDWEYALVLDNHGEDYSADKAGYSMLGQSGVLALYAIPDSSAIELSTANTGYIYREGQEIQLDNSNLQSLALGTWSISDLVGGTDKLMLTINSSLLPTNSGDWGFHWAMSCANDAIEGSFELPEPMTLLLLGIGLSGLVLRRRSPLN